MSGARTSSRKPGARPGRAARVASRSRLQRWLPITAWLRGYHRQWLRYDTIAALTVVGLLVPESMAYARYPSCSDCRWRPTPTPRRRPTRSGASTHLAGAALQRRAHHGGPQVPRAAAAARRRRSAFERSRRPPLRRGGQTLGVKGEGARRPPAGALASRARATASSRTSAGRPHGARRRYGRPRPCACPHSRRGAPIPRPRRCGARSPRRP